MLPNKCYTFSWGFGVDFAPSDLGITQVIVESGARLCNLIDFSRYSDFTGALSGGNLRLYVRLH